MSLWYWLRRDLKEDQSAAERSSRQRHDIFCEILVIVGTSMDEHSLRSQMGMGSESDCLFGQLYRILWTSDSEAGVKTEKSGGVARGEGECGDDVVGLLVRDRRSLDILPVKKGKAVCK